VCRRFEVDFIASMKRDSGSHDANLLPDLATRRTREYHGRHRNRRQQGDGTHGEHGSSLLSSANAEVSVARVMLFRGLRWLVSGAFGAQVPVAISSVRGRSQTEEQRAVSMSEQIHGLPRIDAAP
jgi:hypothetical protein